MNALKHLYITKVNIHYLFIWFTAVWMPFKDFQYVGKHRYVSLNDLDLQPGKTYRVVIKFCAENLCFPYVYSNGVTVIYNPPVTGNISVEIKNTSLAHQEVRHHTLLVIVTLNCIFVKCNNFWDVVVSDPFQGQMFRFFRNTWFHRLYLMGFVLLNFSFSLWCFVSHCLSLCTLLLWPLWCLSFDFRFLITPLVSFNFSIHPLFFFVWQQSIHPKTHSLPSIWFLVIKRVLLIKIAEILLHVTWR